MSDSNSGASSESRAWLVIFVVCFGLAAAALSKKVDAAFDLPFGTGVLSVILLAAGALVGFIGYLIVRNMGNKAKIVVFAVLWICVFCSITALSYTKTDDYISGRQWKEIRNGSLIFEFPEELIQKKTDGVSDSADVLLFKYGGNNRFVQSMIIDFKDDNRPDPAESLENAVVAALAVSRAADLTWLEPDFGENLITSKVEYSIKGTVRTGFAAIYWDGPHYELLMLLPVTADYSASFMQKFAGSIHVAE